ncbi:hypothetical protein LPU83_pLPU83d_0387 (plasmid) [Rhizobium favelukesii]|uniref:Integrase n=1 Tax=Rhizobium favelukesii TaxID=348824 RepID=W6RSH4_9HYPH|nr:hypothetical protein LPU83_pLPU83d_0387 [Rhizobium favelukesii]
MGTAQYDPAALGRPAWNVGRKVGVKKPLKRRQIWAIRFFLAREGRMRDRALFDLAIDSKLQGCDPVKIKIGTLVTEATGNLRAIQILLGHTKIEKRLGTWAWTSRMRWNWRSIQRFDNVRPRCVRGQAAWGKHSGFSQSYRAAMRPHCGHSRYRSTFPEPAFLLAQGTDERARRG